MTNERVEAPKDLINLIKEDVANLYELTAELEGLANRCTEHKYLVKIIGWAAKMKKNSADYKLEAILKSE
jgi:hypothetical protein